MKKIIPIMIAGLATCFLTGCETTGLSMRETSGVSYPNYILSSAANDNGAPAKKPVLPIRLAVAQIGETAPPENLLKKLSEQKNLITSVTALPLPGEPKNYRNDANNLDRYATDLKAACNLAQTAGANYLFVFGGNVDSWRKNNVLSALDLTIVGGVILPGSEIKMEGRGAGALIETASGQVVLFSNADAKESATSPDYLADGKTEDMREKLRDELIEKLSDDFLKKLAEISATKNTN